MNRIRLATLMLAGAWFATSLAAAVAPGLPESVASCAAEQDDARRLSCYDREVARFRQEPSRTEPVPPPPPRAEPAPLPVPVDPEASFGFRGPLAREQLDRQKAEKSKLSQLSSTIVRISTRPYGELVLTLENDQVWVQKSPDRSIQLKVGDPVSIKRGALGSFMLLAPSGRTTQVTRLE